MRPRPPWTTRPPTGQACGRPFGFAGSPPLPGPDAPAVDNRLRLPTACLPLQFFSIFLTGKTDQDTGLRKHQGRGNQRHALRKHQDRGTKDTALRKHQGRGTKDTALRKHQDRGTKDTHSENSKAGGTTKDTGLRKHQGRGAGFCLSGRGADTWAGLHLAREQRACAPAPAGAMPWCWPCRCWWHWPPSRVAALALVTAFPALGLINIVSIYWHDYCGLQYLCHACMIAFVYVASREADLALSALVVSGGGLIVRCTSSGEGCSV